MYKRNMTMFNSMEKKLSEAYIIFARNVPEYKLKLNLLEQVLGEVDKEVFEENKIELFEGKDDDEVETIIVEPDLYIAECQLGGTIEPTTVKYEDLIVVGGEPCTVEFQVAASDVTDFEVGDSTCAQILEESNDEEERLIIDENIENMDEVAFVTNKPIEDMEKYNIYY